MPVIPTLQNLRDASQCPTAMAHLAGVASEINTPQGMQSFLRRPGSMTQLANDLAVVARNADNPLINNALGRNTAFNSITNAVRQYGASQGNAENAAQLLMSINQAGGPQIAQAGRALTQLMGTPEFRNQVNQIQGNTAELMTQIGTLNRQVDQLFPGAGQLTERATGAAQHGLSTGINIVSGFLGK